MTFLILICTLPERANKLRRLTMELDRQKAKYNGLVDYKINDFGRSMPTGIKRNLLVEQSMSDYFSFIDDDDMVSKDYIEQIMLATEQNPDVITFCGWMTTNGENRQNFTIKLGSKYEEKNGHYYRFPNHLCAFKREKVRHIKFPDKWQMEDYDWAKQIHDRKLLKTEVHIESDLYWYDCYPKNHARVRLHR